MTEPNLFEIFQKVAARNPAVPAKASEQKAGDLGTRPSPGGSYFEGSSAGKQGIGDVNRHSAPGSGYVNLNGSQGPGSQGIGLVNRHAAPDGGERGNLQANGMTVTKDAADKTKVSPSAGKNGTQTGRPHLKSQGVANANTTTKAAEDKTMVSQRAADSRKSGRAWLKNQGVAGVNTMTKDATFEELGMISAFADLAKEAEAGSGTTMAGEAPKPVQFGPHPRLRTDGKPGMSGKAKAGIAAGTLLTAYGAKKMMDKRKAKKKDEGK